MAGPDYILDIRSLGAAGHGAADQGRSGDARPWLAVHWRCCNVYSRVYRNREGTAYVGGCPKCARPLRVKIGPGGTNARFFEAH